MKEISELRALTSQITILLKEKDDDALKKMLWLMQQLVDDLAYQLGALETKTQTAFHRVDEQWQIYLTHNYLMLKAAGADNGFIERLREYDELETNKLRNLYSKRLGFSEVARVDELEEQGEGDLNGA